MFHPNSRNCQRKCEKEGGKKRGKKKDRKIFSKNNEYKY
jgi:hypothetical protein